MKLVVYVSCGFQAFQRDCDALIKSGKWKVQFAEGYILFPGSDAIETLAFFVPIQVGGETFRGGNVLNFSWALEWQWLT